MPGLGGVGRRWRHRVASAGGRYLVGGPSLLVGPVSVATLIPPLNLQRVGGGAAAAEGAGHLHVLTRPRRHVVGRLCEQGWAETRQLSTRGAARTAMVAKGSGLKWGQPLGQWVKMGVKERTLSSSLNSSPELSSSLSCSPQ